MPIQSLDATLTTQIPPNLPDLPLYPSIEDLSAVVRYDYDVVLTIPMRMRQTLPLVHRLLLPVPRSLPGRSAYAFPGGLHADSLEAVRLSWPEVVEIASNNVAEPLPAVGFEPTRVFLPRGF